MTNNHISLTVPTDDRKALLAAARMLREVAGEPDLQQSADDPAPKWVTDGPTRQPSPTNTLLDDEERTDPDAYMKGEPTIAHLNVEIGSSNTSTVAPGDDDQPEEKAPSADSADGPDLDVHGLPWDERIHSGNKTKCQDGGWKKKRGVDKASVEQIEQELRDLMAIPEGGAEGPIEMYAGDPEPDEIPDAPQVPEVPPAADELYPELSDKPVSKWGFSDFLKAASKLIVNGPVTLDKVNAACQAHGVQTMHLLGSREDLIPAIWADITEAKS